MCQEPRGASPRVRRAFGLHSLNTTATCLVVFSSIKTIGASASPYVNLESASTGTEIHPARIKRKWPKCMVNILYFTGRVTILILFSVLLAQRIFWKLITTFGEFSLESENINGHHS